MSSTVVTSSVPRSLLVAALRHPNCAKLLTGQVIAAFGDRINQTALLSIVVYSMPNTAKYSADILFWAVFPMVVLGLFAAPLLDRWNRQATMITSDVGRAILAAELPLLMHLIHHHYAIYLVVFWMGAFSALFTPSRLAIMPNLMPRELLLPANVLLSQAGTVATLIAMPIAGLIVEKSGYRTSFLINAATYLVSAVCIWRLKPLGLAPAQSSAMRMTDLWDEFRDGLRYIRRTRSVFFYVVLTGLIQSIVAIFFICFLTYCADVVGRALREKVLVTNLLFGAMGVGMAAGAVWTGRFSKVAESFIWPMLMLAGAGLGILALSLVRNPWAAAGVLFAIGFCSVMVLTPLDTFLQKHVPDSLRGRVFAVRGVIWGAAFLFSLQFSKALIHQCGILPSMKLLGMGAILIGLVGAWLGRKWVEDHG